ncbi:MAG: DUF2309 domain-containing protein [Deltaproteobacteria bacterium]|nr:DUF2309 domain-containing protein [Deltaproteobacteria bacterium]
MVAQIAAPYSEVQRMELRGQIQLASEIISYYWPMRTFVHHNPLHGLEELPFDEAVERGEQHRGGKGYLPLALFRDYYRSGRIQRRHLDEALKFQVTPATIECEGRAISHLEVLRAQLLHSLPAPAKDRLDDLLKNHPDHKVISALATQLEASLPPRTQRPASSRAETLSSWCDRTFGTQITEQINRELIKWCEAFLDEGHATWAMPRREEGFYHAWKYLAQREWSPCGIDNNQEKIDDLSPRPEDALLESLAALGIAAPAWQDYLSLHLAALSGWAGFIKWRADQTEYDWQRAFPIDLVEYLAVRLWYERELVQMTWENNLGVTGSIDALRARFASEAALSATPADRSEIDRPGALSAAWRLVALARALELEPASLANSASDHLSTLLQWLESFAEPQQGGVWLRAFEAGYREALIERVSASQALNSDPNSPHRSAPQSDTPGDFTVRPQAQLVCCIDVRSEPLRRHFEATGDYETFGFAGFFAVAIRHRSLNSERETDQFPVILKSKNLVREIPRSYQGQYLMRLQHRERLVEAGHTLLYDLKGNVITPYVMIESLGWFYSLPMFGKTLFPNWYGKATEWLRHKLVPPVATTLTVDKLSRQEVEEMIASEQRATTRRALQEKFGERNLNLSLERLEFLRRRALDEASAGEPSPQARSTALSPEEETHFVEDLRRDYGINEGAAFARMERITRTGFTLNEQVLTVETALRMMGLVRNFARLVLLCGHGSASENNPFEAALDCGACGGNPGKPNARVLATMANKPLVRQQLAKNGIAIPPDTYFIAGQHNTTTDDVELFDLEDLPPTHRKDVVQLIRDFARAGELSSQERCARFPEIGRKLHSPKAKRLVRRRSNDWSQVRPEWGLSRNAAFIIGRRALTRGIDLEGRVFLHSYDYREDRDGRLLEAIMNGPQIVAQWINMEHYFSTVDHDVYGGGSKIYHNVAGRIAVMSGPQSDLRTGLAWQTVMSGSRPYHEAMRLFTLIEAPRERIEAIVDRQRPLRRLYDNEWLHLIAIEPKEHAFHAYVPRQGWQPIDRPKTKGGRT